MPRYADDLADKQLPSPGISGLEPSHGNASQGSLGARKELLVAAKSAGYDTPISSRVHSIFRNNIFIPDPHFPEWLSAPFRCKGFERMDENEVHVYHTLEERATRIGDFCNGLYDSVHDPTSHVARLDCKFADLLECHFQPASSSSILRDLPSDEVERIVLELTCLLLRRLPARPIELPGSNACVPSAYFAGSGSRSWEDLQVAGHLNTNVIRMALCIICHPFISKGKLSDFINDTATLLDFASQRSSAAKTDIAQHKWYLVRAFLWVSWQRSTMLYFSFLLAQQVESGFDDAISWSVFLQSPTPCPGSSIQQISRSWAANGKSKYMCSWAFELLRNDPVCIGMDFRRFHQRFAEVFGHLPARCSPNPNLSCRGDHPNSCQRFVGMDIRDQSAHDYPCMDCGRLVWDELSYRSISGARAVSLEDHSEKKLLYIAATHRTLAISHVWSHGQGGRPETGMNRCLHLRYKSIALSMGCDSYWMDTPCIPTDHALRHEAIMNINKVFFESKVTLVCDRDLMEIDITESPSIALRESILVALVICDWNLRAWTFLEAFRGRHSIHLLCKRNAIISLRETVEIVHRQGSLEIGNLLLAVPHLRPPVRFLDDPDHPSPKPRGFLSVEYSGRLLSQRPASRPGDDVVIWSLLLHERFYENAEEFWRGKTGDVINTSFLVSTAPRLDSPGLSWAPASPRIISDVSSTKDPPRSMGHDGMEGSLGRITPEGLTANWFMYKFSGGKGRLSGVKSSFSQLGPLGVKPPPANIRKIRKRYLRDYHWGALLRPVWANQVNDMPAPNREDGGRVLLVVVGTNDNSKKKLAWKWKGVHEWDTREPLPSFVIHKEDILIV